MDQTRPARNAEAVDLETGDFMILDVLAWLPPLLFLVATVLCLVLYRRRLP